MTCIFVLFRDAIRFIHLLQSTRNHHRQVQPAKQFPNFCTWFERWCTRWSTKLSQSKNQWRSGRPIFLHRVDIQGRNIIFENRLCWPTTTKAEVHIHHKTFFERQLLFQSPKVQSPKDCLGPQLLLLMLRAFAINYIAVDGGGRRWQWKKVEGEGEEAKNTKVNSPWLFFGCVLPFGLCLSGTAWFYCLVTQGQGK